MPYVEKLKMIKEEKGLTNKQISDLGNIPLATVTRVFNENTINPTFETIVGIAKGIGVSLDELAGFKNPDDAPITTPIVETLSSHSELLKEKDERIAELKERNVKLEKEKDDIRHEKRRITSVLIMIVLILVVGLLIDLLNGDIGKFRY